MQNYRWGKNIGEIKNKKHFTKNHKCIPSKNCQKIFGSEKKYLKKQIKTLKSTSYIQCENNRILDD